MEPATVRAKKLYLPDFKAGRMKVSFAETKSGLPEQSLLVKISTTDPLMPVTFTLGLGLELGLDPESNVIPVGGEATMKSGFTAFGVYDSSEPPQLVSKTSEAIIDKRLDIFISIRINHYGEITFK